MWQIAKIKNIQKPILSKLFFKLKIKSWHFKTPIFESWNIPKTILLKSGEETLIFISFLISQLQVTVFDSISIKSYSQLLSHNE